MAPNVTVWQDDPESRLALVQVEAPDLGQPPLPLQIAGAPAPALYDPNTAEFRYWDAAAALKRGAVFWGSLAPGIAWQPGDSLPVILDGGVDLNAFYDRQALNFFHDTVDGKTVFSGESPDIVCHELGHAVLDALRPELFDAANLETPAFHESFGDMSAILTALRVPELRASIAGETGGHIDRNSELSRLAEQLGAAIRQRSPDAVDSDCLRNAANSFIYHDPLTLPTSGPAAMLSQEPHSLSRVFTGAFLEALAGMALIISPNPGADDLASAGEEMGKLLVAAVRTAPVVPEFYSQVAAALIQADAGKGGRFAPALKSALVRRGILSPENAVATGFFQVAASSVSVAAMAHAVGPERVTQLPLQAVGAAQYGLGNTPLFVHVPAQLRRVVALAAATGGGSATPPSSYEAARAFLEHLMRLGRVDFGPHGTPGAVITHPRARKTHVIQSLDGGSLVLRRKLFYCGFCG